MNEKQKEEVDELLKEKREVEVSCILKKLDLADKSFKSDKNIKRGKISGYKTDKILGEKLCGWKTLSKDKKEEVIRFLSYLANSNDAYMQCIEKLCEQYKICDGEIIEFLKKNIEENKIESLSDFKLEHNRCSYSIDILKEITKEIKDSNKDNKDFNEEIFINKLRERKGVKEKKIRLDRLNLRNTIVERALKQTGDELKYVFKKFGNPHSITVELTRDVKSSLKKRKDYEDRSNINSKNRDIIKKRLEEHNIKATKKNIKKYILWIQQKCRCGYSGCTISLCDLEKAEIDHIVPIKKGGNGVMRNFILAKKEINEIKGNRTPYEAFIRDCVAPRTALDATIKRLKDLYEKKSSVKICGISIDKKELKEKARLLECKKPAEEIGKSKFAEQTFTDTSYIAKVLLKYLKNTLSEGGEGEKKDRVIATRGGLTGYLRKEWGFNDILIEVRKKEGKLIIDKNKEILKCDDRKNFDNFDKRIDHRHHAVDAAVIALTTRNIISKLSKFYKKNNRLPKKKCKEEKEEIPKLDYPNIIKELKDRLTYYVVWHKPDRYPKKEFFQETFYGLDNEGYFTKRVDKESVCKKTEEKIKEIVCSKKIQEILLKKKGSNIKKIKKIKIRYGKNAPQKFNEDQDSSKEILDKDGNKRKQYMINGGYSCIEIHKDEDKRDKDHRLIPNHSYKKPASDKIQIFPNDMIFDKDTEEFYIVRKFSKQVLIQATLASETKSYDEVKKIHKNLCKDFTKKKLKNIILVKDRKDIALIKNEYKSINCSG